MLRMMPRFMSLKFPTWLQNNLPETVPKYEETFDLDLILVKMQAMKPQGEAALRQRAIILLRIATIARKGRSTYTLQTLEFFSPWWMCAAECILRYAEYVPKEGTHLQMFK